jgi:YHS domain-containing protein/thiol-disulfide isomerase/thioredoxin
MPDRSRCQPRSGPRPGLGLGVALLACGVLRADPPAAIAWRSDLDEARREAQARGLPLWVQFTGPWCHNCRRLEREALAYPKVVALAHEGFVPVKLRSDVHEAFALSLGLSILPATVILGPDGTLVAKHEGYAEPEAFLAFLSQARPRWLQTALVARRAKPKPSSPPAVLAMAGYCPVTLVKERRLALGAAEWTARHDGLEFRFASRENRDAFLKEPEAFLPVNRGRCPVRQVEQGETVTGDAHFGVLYRNRLYLCADESARARFLKEPSRYADVDVADDGFCPHCRSNDGLLVRGQPRFAATHRGRRYLFPDAAHLAAFRADPDKYVR